MINEKEFLSIAKGLYPKYIKDARECVTFIFETLVKTEHITPKEISELSSSCGFSKESFINNVVEKLERRG